MPTTTLAYLGGLPFVADRDSLVFDTGHSIDWTAVDASFIGADGKKFIPAGKEMRPTVANDLNSPLVPVTADTGDVAGILATNAHEDNGTDARSGYAILRGGHLYENLLPGAAGGPPKVLRALARAALLDSTNGRFAGFAFSQYRDNTA